MGYRALSNRRKLKMSIISAFLTIFGSIEARSTWPNVKMLKNGQHQQESEKNSEEKLFILLSAAEIKISISSMILNSIELPLCGFLKHLNNSGRIFNTKQIRHFSL